LASAVLTTRAAGRPESMVGRQAAQPWLATIGLI